MQSLSLESFDAYLPTLGTYVGWVLLIGIPAIWFIGQIGLLNVARRIGVYTPMLTAFVGSLILFKLQAWPFSGGF
jgi:hypothetical protein